MNTKTRMLVAGLAVAIVSIVAGLVSIKRQADQEARIEKPLRKVPVAAPASLPTAAPEIPEQLPLEVVTSTDSAPQIEPVKADAQAKIKAQPPSAQVNQPQAIGDQDHQDPMAREALSLVGADPDAEAYWIEAINDPNLSAVERESLISDLNEDGLSDFKHPTLDDLPLIMNRLSLIEELAPHAMDQVNAKAFREAYDDLLNLAEITQGRGKPVN